MGFGRIRLSEEICWSCAVLWGVMLVFLGLFWTLVVRALISAFSG